MRHALLMITCCSLEAMIPQLAAAQTGAAPPQAPANGQGSLVQPPDVVPDGHIAPRSPGAVLPRSAKLEEVVVVAQRRSENLQKVPIAITAITARAAAAAGITGSRDLSIVVPGLNFETVVGNATPYLRGIGTSAVSAGNESPVATYVDGVYIAGLPGGILSLNNIDRVEVLKGPQGTLFGRNATGGLIQVITRTPSMTAPRLDATVGYGNYNTFNGQIYASVPVTDHLAADFAAYFNNQGKGWGRNDATGNEVNKETDLSLRSKIVGKVNDDVSVTTILDYNQVKGSIGVAVRALDGTLPIFGVPFTGKYYDINSDHQPALDTKTGGASVQVRVNTGIGQIVSITSARDLSSMQSFDQDVTPVNGINVVLNEQDRYITQELQLQSPKDNGRFHWIVGGFYFYDNSQYSPVVVNGIGIAPLTYINTFDTQINNSFAAFGQATYEVLPNTHLTAGIRYTYDMRTFSGYTTSNFGQLYATPGVLTQNSGAPSWRLSLDHTFPNGMLTYLSYNRGFKAGIFNGDDLKNPPLSPETLDAFEIGEKARFFGETLQVNAAAFLYDYSNIQLMRTQAGLQELLNAAAARIYGADLDAVAVISPDLTIRGGLELLHGTYTRFPGAVFNAPLPFGGYRQYAANGAGEAITNTPPFTADLSADYRLESRYGEAAFNATGYYNAGWFGTVDNRLKQHSYELLNAQIAFQPAGARYEVRLWGKNLTNTKYFLQLQTQSLSEGGAVAAPLTFGVSVHWTL